MAALALAIGLASGLASCGKGDQTSTRRAEVAERGAEVMPFDLDATTHRFEPTDDGLVETVVADDAHDAAQIGLIRDHLADEAVRFRRGDYGDPARIHGHDMPGLADLEANADAITIRLDNLPDGARITFATSDRGLVDALHAWGEAQLMDHGEHAEGR